MDFIIKLPRTLIPRFVESFKILKRIGSVTYQLKLIKKMARVQNAFNITNLRKCVAHESLMMPLQDIEVNEKLKFIKQPIQIQDRRGKKKERLKRKKLILVKVKWNSRRGHKYTWELESEMRRKYTHIFQ